MTAATIARLIGIKGFIAIGLALVLAGMWLVHKHDVGRIERLQFTVDSFAAAQKEADRLAKAQLAAKEAEYRTLAKDADHDHEAALSEAMGATDRYIASHRVCPANRGASSSAIASAPNNDPGIIEGVSASAGVAISEPDLRALSESAAYAVTCHNWAVSLTRSP